MRSSSALFLLALLGACGRMADQGQANRAETDVDINEFSNIDKALVIDNAVEVNENGDVVVVKSEAQ